MSISVGDSLYSYMTQTADTANSSVAAGSLNSTITGLSGDSSEAEMKQAIKDFESYFVEQMLKKVEESLSDDEDSANSQMSEYFLGQVGEQLADDIVEEVGGSLTQTLYEQMCRNYGITAADTE